MSRPDAASDDEPAHRLSIGRWKPWIHLRGGRHAVAGLVLLGVFIGVVGLNQVAPTSLRTAMETGDPVETAFQAMITSIITGVTLVVTITQVVISQELGPLGDQRERMAGSMSFREDVEALMQRSVSPPEPSAFLAAVLGAVQRHASDLADGASEAPDPETRERLTDYGRELAGDARRVRDELDGTQFGTFAVTFAALDFDYGRHVYRGRRLRAERDLPDRVADSLDAALDALEFYGPAREHVKTLYFQWELIDLSRELLYVAVPALVVSVSMVLYADLPAVVTGTTFGVDDLVWLVAAAVTVALAPFSILLAYVLRIGTVAQRTLAIGPLLLRETDRSRNDEAGPIDEGE